MKPILEMNLKEYDEYLKSICCPDPNCGVFPGQYHDELVMGVLRDEFLFGDRETAQS